MLRTNHLSELWKKHRLALGILLATHIAFFSRTLFLGQIYFLDDLKIIYYPLEHVYASFQANWQLPLWSELFGFGQPLLAWGQLGFFTPVHVLLRFLGLHPLILLQASILLYFALGLLGMYWFLIRSKLEPLAAALGAIVYVFCGFHVGHLNHVNFYVGTMVLPWLLVATHYFVGRPTMRSAALLAIPAAVIPLSSQPQVSLYCLIIAGIYGLIRVAQKAKNYKLLTKTVILTTLAGLVALGLSSLSILPLMEFLPQTDRAGDLPAAELFEFSYPPSHLITLLNPYFFGDHDRYWGAKNFQELAAYVGFLPLLLTPLGFFSWHRRRALIVFGLLLVLIALLLAPGIHSPLYKYLVDHHIITSLAIPGRFVFFFDTGVAILSALGLSFLLKRLPAAGLPRLGAVGLVVAAAANLVYFGWHYNPLTPARAALTEPLISQELKSYRASTGLPARLYSAATLALAGVQEKERLATDPISPFFSVHQPFTLSPGARCITFPAQAETGAVDGTIIVEINETIGGPALVSRTLPVDQIDEHNGHQLCLTAEQRAAAPRPLIFTARSDTESRIRLFYQTSTEPSVYFVRVPNPTADQINQSQKNGRLVFELPAPLVMDGDLAWLARHIQVTADASSARWIGALSIAPFRDLIEDLFANDREPFNGDGVHALVHNRPLVNMSGITHLAQLLPVDVTTDSIDSSGYEKVAEQQLGSEKAILYRNPAAFPKAFLVPDAVFEPVDMVVRHRLSQPDYKPEQFIFVNGPTPPANLPAPRGRPTSGTAQITRYEPTRVEIEVSATEDSWLVLTDSYSPQWQTLVDNAPQDPFSANTAWRAARVNAGDHLVIFQYHSPAAARAQQLMVAAIFATVLMLLWPSLWFLPASLRR